MNAQALWSGTQVLRFLLLRLDWSDRSLIQRPIPSFGPRVCWSTMQVAHRGRQELVAVRRSSLRRRLLPNERLLVATRLRDVRVTLMGWKSVGSEVVGKVLRLSGNDCSHTFATEADSQSVGGQSS